MLRVVVDNNSSGDKHLKGLQVYRGIPVVTARELLEILEQQD